MNQAPRHLPEPPSITNRSSQVIPCPRKGCPGIAPGVAHQPSTGGFSCTVMGDPE